jgi:homoserine kinase
MLQTSPMAERTGSQLRAARVRVPGSTSNLGAGFDSVGLALNRYFRASFEPGDGELRVVRGGTLAGLTVADDEDTFVRAFRTRLQKHGKETPGGLLQCESEIPLARGMGSSAAAVVAGLALADAAANAADWLSEDAHTGAGARQGALAWAEAWEGHPDNAAPSLFGGLIAVARDEVGRAHAFELPLAESIGLAFAAPARELNTRQARAALPATVPHPVATRAVGRTAALVRGLASGEPALLRLGFEDELHVPYRLPLIPGGRAALSAAREAGAWAATISGSGTGLLAVCAHEAAETVAAAMAAAFQAAGEVIDVAFPMMPDRAGARVLEVSG